MRRRTGRRRREGEEEKREEEGGILKWQEVLVLLPLFSLRALK